jgi:hypothetical protein
MFLVLLTAATSSVYCSNFKLLDRRLTTPVVFDSVLVSLILQFRFYKAQMILSITLRR